MTPPESNDLRCSKKVSDHTGFHWWPCGKPAKFRVTSSDGQSKLVCGIHARYAKRWNTGQVTALEQTP